MATEKRMDQVVLGLLDHTPMTGYEIKKRIDGTLHFFWSGSFGSIYPTLRSLEADGRICKLPAENGGRGKIPYAITETGRASLRAWLAAPDARDELHYETLLKLFFGAELGAPGTIEHIEAFEARIRAELPYLEGSVKQLSALQNEPAHRYYLLTAMFGADTYRTYLAWCEKAKAILRGENEKD